ncbi:RNA polymerase factor sigma-54 [Myxococcota bacterium]|nr:RNA polymerase factor sigma-54 [Myxococcota bacterium]
MALELKQQLKVTQQLVMTPQLQQAIKLLQLSQIELVGLVQTELAENPVLEEVVETEEELGATESRESEGAGVSGETPAESEAQANSDVTDEVDRGETVESGEPVDSATLEIAADLDASEPSDAEKVADLDWENYIDTYPQTNMREFRDDNRSAYENTAVGRESLAEHLRWQLQLIDLEETEQAVADFIIGNLDDAGYLELGVEEISKRVGVDIEVVEESLKVVQGLDPCGVACRDLRECLQIQVRVLAIDDPLVIRIIEEGLELLMRRDFRGLARHFRVTVEEIAAASTVIGRLEPRPGRAFGGDEPVYIVPDIYLYKIGEDFHVVLNDDGLPRLRVNGIYRQALAQTGAKLQDPDTKEFVDDKVRSALWLIKSIHQRQRTIYRVMQSIIGFQRDFFEKGVSYLKPLNLRDVAEDIGMHESTISRVTTNKYVHTSQGIFELKYFFNSRVNRVDGEAMASESVKERIHKLIRNEDPRRPLSDQRIAEMLKVANISIARRTVTKYRESLNILSSTKRRQVG